MSRHLKTLASPKSWTLLRKVTKWLIRPLPGAHTFDKSIAIGLLLKQLGCARTSNETKKIINQKLVFVDQKLVKDRHYSTGFMDTIQIKPEIKVRCTLDEKGRLKFIDIPESELNKKICKITARRTVKDGKIQINLSDGRNILSDNKEYKVGDSLQIELPSQKISAHYSLEKGNTVFLTGGKHTATIGKIEDVQGERIWCTTGKEKIETLKKFAIVVGKDKPAVKL